MLFHFQFYFSITFFCCLPAFVLFMAGKLLAERDSWNQVISYCILSGYSKYSVNIENSQRIKRMHYLRQVNWSLHKNMTLKEHAKFKKKKIHKIQKYFGNNVIHPAKKSRYNQQNYNRLL